jgi:hypothetical protein
LESTVVNSKFSDSLEYIALINESKTPTEKIYLVLLVIEEIYNILGEDSGCDAIFPCLVYILVKSQTANLYLNLIFINAFKRERRGKCGEECNHLEGGEGDIEKVCECVEWIGCSDKEIEYYCTLFEAAIFFIEKLEYSSLSVSKEEYDRNIIPYSKEINIKKEKKKVVKMKKLGLFEKAREKILNFINNRDDFGFR